MRAVTQAAVARLQRSGVPDQACLCEVCPCPTYVHRPRVCVFCAKGNHVRVSGLGRPLTWRGNPKGNQGATRGNRLPHA